MQLPADLADFLAAGRRLEYDADAAEPGMLELRTRGALSPGALYASSAEEGHPPGMNEEPGAGADPHLEQHGHYVVPAVDLVASCTGDFPPHGLLAWIPSLDMYATWDSGHLEILVFPHTTWADIAAAPLRYVNAQWSDDPLGYYLAPWLHGFEWRRGPPPAYGG